MAEEKILQCNKCKCDLEPRTVSFQYLGKAFSADILCCPICGLKYIPEDLATGRMAEVEMMLEEK